VLLCFLSSLVVVVWPTGFVGTDSGYVLVGVLGVIERGVVAGLAGDGGGFEEVFRRGRRGSLPLQAAGTPGVR
jgi:hypothetical protein